jgi:hypothetical protein
MRVHNLIVLSALACIAGGAKAAEVWTGGSRAWGDFTTAGNENQWTFLRENVDGFYTNNFSMRPAESDTPTREERLAGMFKLLKNKRLFYETDRVHSSDAFDRASIDMFLKQGFDYSGTTINYGTNEARNRIITRDGQVPLYYMFGPWNGEGDISKPKNDDLRSQIGKYAGAAVDDPVTMWRGPNGHKDTRSMVYSTIKWCHANNQKFLFLLAPNDSGKTFLPESQQLVRDLEDHDANPDMFAVEFYGPKSFRDKLDILPESDAAGRPAATFSGVPYWLIHHLRDPKNWARLSLPAAPSAGAYASDVQVNLTNSSDWLDLTPVVRLRPIAAEGYRMRVSLGGFNVTSAILGDGVVFNGKQRLNPGDSRRLILHQDRDGRSANTGDGSATWAMELLPHPSEPDRINQTLIVRMGVSAPTAIRSFELAN